MILGWAAACALRHVPHYEPVAFDLAEFRPESSTWLAADLRDDLRRGRLRLTDAEGSPIADPDSLPPEVVHAIWGTFVGWTRGAELDLLVGPARRPVSVWWSTDGAARVAWGDAAPSSTTTGDAATIAARHGVRVEDSDRTWSPGELTELDLALTKLRSREREIVAGVAFVRAAESPRRHELAYYDPRSEPPTITIFDPAFAMDAQGFVGDPSAPLPAGVASVLHEIGHAVADAPARAAFATWERTGDPEALRAWLAARRRGPSIDAWQAFRDGRPGPSTFGFRDPHESFAEAFALAHLDPAALDRTLPGATAWFADRDGADGP